MTPRPVRRPVMPVVVVFASLAIAVAALFSPGSGTIARAEDPPPEPSFSESPSPTPTPVGQPPGCSEGDFTGPLPEGAYSLSGTVRDGLGAGIGDLRVRIASSEGGLEVVETSGSGTWIKTGLGDSSYTIAYFDQTATYQSGFYAAGGFTPVHADAVPVVIAASSVSGVDVELPAEAARVIAGRVTDHFGNPVSGIAITARSPYFPIVGCTVTDGNGDYQITALRVGAYRIDVSDPSGFHPDGFYLEPAPGFTRSITAATVVGVEAGNAAGIDIEFPETFSISGTAATADQIGVGDVSVAACEPGTFTCSYAQTGPDGTYTIFSLPAGDYVVRVYAGHLGYLNGYYGPSGFTRVEALAAVVSVVAQDVTDIDIVLVPAATISGRITDQASAPVENIYVDVCDEDAGDCGSGVTFDDGAYQTSGLQPGTYLMFVTDYSHTHPSGYLGAGGTLVPDPADALALIVGTDDIIGIDVVIPAGGMISAVVTSGGTPAAGVTLEVCGTARCYATGYTDGSGAYTSSPLLAGSYLVSAYDSETWEQRWYVSGAPATSDFTEATPVVVTAGATTAIAFDLSSAGGPPPGDTPAGTNVAVPLTDGGGGGAAIATVTFPTVTSPGITTLTVASTGPAVPAGFSLGDPPTYYDISTTATFDGLVTICISYTGVTFGDPAALHLYHYDGTSWVDTTVLPIDTGNEVICGSTSSFSPFAIVERAYGFLGFYGEVKGPPKVISVQAGAKIKVQFEMVPGLGADIFASGSPSSTRIDCSTGLPTDIPVAVVPGHKSLSGDRRGRYGFDWTTDKAWKSTCRVLTLTFRDGTIAEAFVSFTK